MSSTLLLIVACLILLAAGFFSGCEMGLYSLNRVRLRIRAAQGSGNARLLLRLEEDRSQSILGVLLWQNVAGYLLMVVASAWLVQASGLDPSRVEFYSAVLLTPFIFVFGDVTPKNWFQLEADRLMYPAARPLFYAVKAFRVTGVLWLLERVSRLAVGLAGDEQRKDWLGPRGEIVWLLREGAAEGVLSEEQTQIVERVLNLSRVKVRSAMIPRERVAAVPLNMTRPEFVSAVRGQPYSRMPVVGADGRTVVGILHVAQALAEEDHFDIAAIMRPPLFIPWTHSAAAALIQLQRADSKMAIVVHPRRGFIGIVTLKDLVEEIFGELPAW